MSDREIRNAAECTRVLADAIDQQQPDLEVFDGILRLIAAFVPFGETALSRQQKIIDPTRDAAQQ